MIFCGGGGDDKEGTQGVLELLLSYSVWHNLTSQTCFECVLLGVEVVKPFVKSGMCWNPHL